MLRFLLSILVLILLYRLVKLLWHEHVRLRSRATGTKQANQSARASKLEGLDIEDADFEEVED